MNTPDPSRKRLLFLVTEDWYFASHRLELAREAKKAGFEIVVATRISRRGDAIRKEGFRLIPIRLKRTSRNPLSDFFSVLELISIYRREKPDVVHHVAMKPILYGSLAARFTGVPAVINAFAGLGYVFIGTGLRVRLLRFVMNRLFYWVIPRQGSRTIFQNPDDRDFLSRQGAVRNKPTVIIKGNGIRLVDYPPLDEPPGDPVFILPGRMLWDKGVGEFAEAAGMLKSRGVRAEFVLAGMVDRENPACIPERKIKDWELRGWVRWMGHQKDIREVFKTCHAVVLPSYREGFPKALLEGAACGRPLIATDVPGCREIVRDGENGILVPPKNPEALAAAMTRLIENTDLRRTMGARGRVLVEKEFSVQKIADQTISVYRELFSDQS